MRSRFRLPCLFFLGAGMFVGLASFAEAQVSPMTRDDLVRCYKDSERWRKLFNGEEMPTKADKLVAENAAKWFIYRITVKEYTHNKKDNEFNPNLVYKEFTDNILTAIDPKHAANGKNKAFVDLYAAELVKAFQEVLGLNPVPAQAGTAVHVSAMMPTMARLKHKTTTDFLIKLIKDDKETHDAVRLYAFKATRELMPVWQQKDPNPTNPDFENYASAFQNGRRAHDSAVVDALTAFIERPRDLSGMSEEEVNAIRYVRREAIIALAHAGAPAVNAYKGPVAGKKEDIVKGLIAPTLMKVCTKTGLSPEPSLSEKVEAALGLCQLKFKQMPEYNPDVAVYLVGRTLMEFSAEYNKDYTKFSAEPPVKKLPYLPWRGNAARFKIALEKELIVNAKDTSAAKKAAELTTKALPILDAMSAKRYAIPPAGTVPALTIYVNQIQPQNGKAFKTLKVPAVPLN